jgi:H/ACA ribonucleoprotein complex subunit 4
MVELRRTRVSNCSEGQESFTKLHNLADAYQLYKEKGEDAKLRKLIKPIEQCLEGIRAVMIRDTAVDALCHGAQLAVPGVVAVPSDMKPHELVGIYTLKGEVVGLAQAELTTEEIENSTKGIAFSMKRIIMKPGTYPKVWRKSSQDFAAAKSQNIRISLDKLEEDDANFG